MQSNIHIPLERAVRDYIVSLDTSLDYCAQCESCCDSFGGSGPRVYSEELLQIVNALQRSGKDDLAVHVQERGYIPVSDDEPVGRRCLALDDEGCSIHSIYKPHVCSSAPYHIMVADDLTIVAEMYPGSPCRGRMDEQEVLARLEWMVPWLEKTFCRRFSVRVHDVVEGRYQRFCGEER